MKARKSSVDEDRERGEQNKKHRDRDVEDKQKHKDKDIEDDGKHKDRDDDDRKQRERGQR